MSLPLDVRRIVVGTLVLAIAAAACSPAATHSPGPSASPGTPSASTPAVSPGGSPAPSFDVATTYRQIAAQVVAIRGLDAPSQVVPSIIDRATLERNLTTEFDKQNPVAEVTKTERVYKALGLLPAAASLRDLYLQLQGSQVIGYYDPTVKQLFIVSTTGGLGPTQRVTYAHEFTHELQDLHFDLASLGIDTITDDSDRALATLALVEGDAVSVQTRWMIDNLSAADLAQVAAEASDPAVLAVLAKTPSILLESSLFPYQAGATFVGSLQAAGGNASVNAAFTKPPISTEQVLHPEKYAAGEGPVDVGLPGDLASRVGAGWSVATRDTLGELQLRVWLKAGSVAGDAARQAAEGWGGDRLALLDGPSGASLLVLVTAWDTQGDADEFATAASGAITGLGLPGLAVEQGTRVVVGLPSGNAPTGSALRQLLEGLAAPGA